MPIATRTNVTCPNCRQPYPAIVEMVVDAQQDPEAKVRLLSGQLNTVQCPNCGAAVVVASPLIYHDSSKELLITFVPMELGIPKDQQERLIGDLMRELTSRLPQSSIKGYIFQPRQALTMQGLIEQILQADGVTPEMIEQQRSRARLIETLLSAPPEQLPALVQQHDAEIDAAFLQTMGLFAQQALASGQREAAEHIVLMQQQIMQLSSYGQQIIASAQEQQRTVLEVQNDLRSLGSSPTRADFMRLVLGYAGDDDRLQALVGMARGAFDDNFFSDLNLVTGQAPAEDRDALEALRDRLQELMEAVDQEAQQALAEAAGFLQALINSPNPDVLMRENRDMIDDAFMAVLSANLQRAQEQGNLEARARFQTIYDQAIAIVQESMSPEMRLINQLLGAQSAEEADSLLRANASTMGPALIELLGALENAFGARGEPELLERARALRSQVESIIGG